MERETLIMQVKVDVGNDVHFRLKYVCDCSGSHIIPFLGNIGNETLITSPKGYRYKHDS